MSNIKSNDLNKPNSFRKLGLVLSGGGTRGLAHVGVLKTLEKNDIPIDMIAGTSMGGVIGAAYAAGMSLDEIERITDTFKSTKDFLKTVEFNIPGSSILRGQSLVKFFKEHLGEITFEELDIPLGVVAVDIQTGEEVHLLEGSVVKALRATSSLPAVFNPAEYNGRQFVDGGLLNNLPVDLAQKMGADVVLAVDVMTKTDESFWQVMRENKIMAGNFGEAIKVIVDCVNILLRHQSYHKIERHPPTILIKPDIASDVTMLSGSQQAENIIEAGVAATKPVVSKLKNELQVKHVSPH